MAMDGLAGLPVADDQLPLAAADGDHGVDGLDAGLQGHVDRFPVDDARSGHFDGRGIRCEAMASLAVNGLDPGH